MGGLARALGTHRHRAHPTVARLRVRVSVRIRDRVHSPASQTFVSDLVGDADLSNAVALNSTSFNAAVGTAQDVSRSTRS